MTSPPHARAARRRTALCRAYDADGDACSARARALTVRAHAAQRHALRSAFLALDASRDPERWSRQDRVALCNRPRLSLTSLFCTTCTSDGESASSVTAAANVQYRIIVHIEVVQYAVRRTGLIERRIQDAIHP